MIPLSTMHRFTAYHPFQRRLLSLRALLPAFAHVDPVWAVGVLRQFIAGELNGGIPAAGGGEDAGHNHRLYLSFLSVIIKQYFYPKHVYSHGIGYNKFPIARFFLKPYVLS